MRRRTRALDHAHTGALGASVCPRPGTGVAVSPAGPNMSSPDLELVHLVKRYGATTAVDRIDLRIAAGRYCCLLGPSGCGKTTTLRMIAGHEAVSERRHPARPAQRHRPARRRARHGDDVPELRAVPAPERARQRRLQPEDARRRQGGAPARARRSCSSASRWRRIAASACRPSSRAASSSAWRSARALITEPQVLLLDEPLSALDPFLRIRMRAELKRWQKKLGDDLRPRHPLAGRGDGAGRPGGGDERTAGSSSRARRTRSSTRRAPSSSPASSAATTSFATPPAAGRVRADRTRLSRAPLPAAANVRAATVRGVEYQGTHVLVTLAPASAVAELSVMRSPEARLRRRAAGSPATAPRRTGPPDDIAPARRLQATDSHRRGELR